MYKKTVTILLLLFLFLLRSYCSVQAEDNNEFRFVVMGYEHPDLFDTQNYTMVVEKIKQHKPDFVLSLGNMAEGKTSSCYSFEHKNNLFIYLDSKSGLKRQSDFLKGTLVKASQYTNVFISTNDALWLKDDRWLKTIHPIIKNKVKYVFGINGNFLNEKEIDNVTYITSGSVFCYSKENTENPSFPNFLIVAVNKRGVIVVVMPLEILRIKISKLLNNDLIYSRVLKSSEQRFYELTSPQRDLNILSTRIIKTLNIKPNMNILDIGAGPGFFTFLMAKALKGTGMVFATELREEYINYIRKKAEEDKYKNVSAVRVTAEGVDPFYKEHSFDIIFLCKVYTGISGRLDYSRQLRPSLIKNSGRLYIIESFNAIIEFNEKEFDNFRNVIKALSSEGENFPVFQRLDKKIQHFIKNWQGGDIPSEIRAKLIQNFNKMLSDRFLLNDLSDYYGSNQKYGGSNLLSLQNFLFPKGYLNEEDIRKCGHFITNLYGAGFLNKNNSVTYANQVDLINLNRVLLGGLLRSSKLSLSEVLKNDIISTMESAGYRFVQSYDFIPNHHFLVFKRSF